MWFDILTISLVVLVFVWMFLVLWMFRRLRVRHAEAFEAIGSPSLFWNNSPRNNWLFLKFLFQGQWRQLGDRQLAISARIMQAVFVVYVLGFVALFAEMF
jgi:hypothetical protein